MSNIFCILLLFLCILMDYVNTQDIPASPCPSIFEYKYDGSEWSGFIEVPSPELGGASHIKVYLSYRAEFPSQDYGSLKVATDKNVAYQQIVNGQPIQYKLRFAIQSPLPEVKSIEYNSRVICSGPEEHGPFVTSIHLQHTINLPPMTTIINKNRNPYQDNTYSNPYGNNYKPIRLESEQPAIIRPTNSKPPQRCRPSMLSPTMRTRKNQQQQLKRQQQHSELIDASSSIIGKLSDNDICGKAVISHKLLPLVIGGEGISRGAWPWLTAIYISGASSLTFVCGGTLVSNKVVITAAHCFKTPKKVYQAHEVLVYLGRFSMKSWEKEEGSETRESAVLKIHPDFMKYSANSYDADIAVIVLKTPVQYNHFIRPICLWNGPSDIRVVEGVMGTVVGWGRNENGDIVTPEPKKTKVPVVADSVCLRSDDLFIKLTSNRTFCAGSRDGTGPCSGDSGGGMAMILNHRWALRGIVSVAALDQVNYICDLNKFVVFTDAAKFVQWIKSFITL